MPPKKRTKAKQVADDGSDVDDQKSPANKKQKDAQKTGAKHLVVPVDEGCNAHSDQFVHIGTDGTIYDASLNQTNAGANNNKFYRIQVIQAPKVKDFWCWNRWGRVGERGQSSLAQFDTVDKAIATFEKKFKDKSGHKWIDRLEPPKKGKYLFIERDYDDAEDDDDGAKKDKKGKAKRDPAKPREIAESKLDAKVQSLMSLIFNQNFIANNLAALNYDSNKLPLGKLSKRTIRQGFEALKDLSELMVNNDLAMSKHGSSYNQAVQDLSNLYFTVIPHAFGRNRPPTISSQNLLEREIDLLDSLTDMSIADEIMQVAEEDVEGVMPNPLDGQFNGLNLSEMAALDHESLEFTQLEDYLIKSHGDTHYLKFKVEEIFRIERVGEKDRFTESQFGKVKGKKSDRRLLWHGSRATNYGGILSQGLRIAPPEAPVTGYMFGKGVYLADVSSKSANYCAHSLSDNTALLLLCEAELGNPMLELTGADYNAGSKAVAQGSFATWGKGRTAPLKWKDGAKIHKSLKGVKVPDIVDKPGDTNVQGAGLMYNEFICYDVAQIRLRYLFRVKVT